MLFVSLSLILLLFAMRVGTSTRKRGKTYQTGTFVLHSNAE